MACIKRLSARFTRTGLDCKRMNIASISTSQFLAVAVLLLGCGGKGFVNGKHVYVQTFHCIFIINIKLGIAL